MIFDDTPTTKYMITSESLTASLRTAPFGLMLAVFTILFGQGLGIVFGLNEDALKSRLKASAAEVRDTVYKGDEAAIKAVLDKSWVYMQRAHLHAGGMGTTALALIVLVGLLGASRRWMMAVGLGLGAGGFGYSVFWMWAGFRAPAPPRSAARAWRRIRSSGSPCPPPVPSSSRRLPCSSCCSSPSSCGGPARSMPTRWHETSGLTSLLTEQTPSIAVHGENKG